MLLSRRDFLRGTALAAGAALTGETLFSGSPGGAASLSERSLLNRAASFEIHPGIGIARVGNSPDAFYFGPEILGGVPSPAAGFKDASGAMAQTGDPLPHLRYGARRTGIGRGAG